MLHKTNYLALVGGGKNPKFSPNKVFIWDASEEKEVIELEFKNDVKNVSLRKNRIVVVLINSIVVYSFEALPKKLATFETGDNPSGIAVLCAAQNNETLAFPGRKAGHVNIIDLSTLSLSPPPVSTHKSESADSDQVTLVSPSDAIQKHSFPSNTSHTAQTAIIPAHTTEISCLALNKPATLLATASSKGTLVRVFDPATGVLLHELRRGSDRAEIWSIAFNHDSTKLCVGSDKGTIHIFNLDMTQPTNQIQTMTGSSPGNRQSSLSFMKDILPKYFSSAWSFATCHVPSEARYISAFCHDQNSIIVLSVDGGCYKFEFDPERGGECRRTEFHRLIKSAKREIEVAYFIMAASQDSSSVDLLASLEDLAVPETALIFYFYSHGQPAFTAKLVSEYETEFPDKKEPRLQIIPCTDVLSSVLAVVQSSHSHLPTRVNFNIIFPSFSTGNLNIPPAWQQEMGLLFTSNRSFQLAIGGNVGYPGVPCIPDLHKDLMMLVNEGHRELFRTTIVKVLKILCNLKDKTVFCAGSFDFSLNLSYLPFCSLLIFNHLVREGILLKASDEDLKKIVSKNPHVVHLLNRPAADMYLTGLDSGLQLTVWNSPVVNLIQPVIYQGPRIIDPSRLLPFEEKLLQFETSTVEDTMDPHYFLTGSYQTRLKQFLETHYSNPHINYETHEHQDVFTDETVGYVCKLTILDSSFESKVYPTAEEAKERISERAFNYFTEYYNYAKETKFLAGKLETYLSRETTLPLSQCTSQTISKTSEDSSSHARVLFHEYFQKCRDPLPPLNFEEIRDRYSANVQLGNTTFRTTRLHPRKNDARQEIANYVIHKLQQKLRSDVRLNYDYSDFE